MGKLVGGEVKTAMVKERNPEIGRGIYKYSRSVAFSKKGRWTKNLKKGAKKVADKGVKPVIKKIGGAKNGGQRTVLPKAPKFYPADDVKTPLKNRRKPKAPKLRSSITPGTVLILLSGRFRGKRVVFLKQLESGLLLVTGPYAVNGVPHRRVNQRFCIVTSTKVDLKKADYSKVV